MVPQEVPQEGRDVQAAEAPARTAHAVTLLLTHGREDQRKQNGVRARF